MISSYVSVAEWSIFGKELLTQLFVFCHFVILILSNFSFEGKTLILIAPIPGHCLPFILFQQYKIFPIEFRIDGPDQTAYTVFQILSPTLKFNVGLKTLLNQGLSIPEF